MATRDHELRRSSSQAGLEVAAEGLYPPDLDHMVLAEDDSPIPPVDM